MKDEKLFEFGFESFRFVESESSDVVVVCTLHVCLPDDTGVGCTDPVCCSFTSNCAHEDSAHANSEMF